MATSNEGIVNSIKSALAEIDQAEGPVILKKIEVGKLLNELRKKAGTGWIVAAKLADLDHRTALRYRAIARSWWGESGLDAELATKLPSDLQKLEYLCRLSPQQLESWVRFGRAKEMSRARLIMEVQKELGKKATAPRPDTPTFERLEKACDKAVDDLLNVVVLAKGELADQCQRELIIELILERITEVQSAVGGDNETDSDPESDVPPSTAAVVEVATQPSVSVTSRPGIGARA